MVQHTYIFLYFSEPHSTLLLPTLQTYFIKIRDTTQTLVKDTFPVIVSSNFASSCLIEAVRRQHVSQMRVSGVLLRLIRVLVGSDDGRCDGRGRLGYKSLIDSLDTSIRANTAGQ